MIEKRRKKNRKKNTSSLHFAKIIIIIILLWSSPIKLLGSVTSGRRSLDEVNYISVYFDGGKLLMQSVQLVYSQWILRDGNWLPILCHYRDFPTNYGPGIGGGAVFNLIQKVGKLAQKGLWGQSFNK
jgi:hypothetical protein